MYMYIIEISLFVCRSCLALCLLKCSVFMFGSVCVCVCVCTLPDIDVINVVYYSSR